MSANRNKVFFVGLPLSLVIAFTAHVYLHSIYNYALFGSYIVASYLFNFGFVLLEIWLLNWRRMKEGGNLGNVYLLMSMVKFLVFFVAFIPLFKLDGVQDRFEYFGFFVPYAICLFAGTGFLINVLKQTDAE